jgi:hypothetical protein
MRALARSSEPPLPKRAGMPIPIDVSFSRPLNGTARRIFQLLSEMGTSNDAVWPFASQPFIRSSGPLVIGTTEEWHLGVHAILDSVEPEKSLVWRFDNEGVDGTHGFYLVPEGKKIVLTHRIVATLSDTEGRMFWRRIQDAHERAIDGLFDKITRVLKR